MQNPSHTVTKAHDFERTCLEKQGHLLWRYDVSLIHSSWWTPALERTCLEKHGPLQRRWTALPRIGTVSMRPSCLWLQSLDHDAIQALVGLEASSE